MRALVGLGVGEERCPQQRQAHGGGRAPGDIRRPADVMAVGGVVGHRDAVTGLTDVHPAVRTGLEAGRVPGRVLVRGSEDVAELDLGGRAFGVQVEREGELEQLLPLVPVDVEGEIDRWGPGGQSDLLDQARCAERPHHAHSDQGRSVDEDLDRLRAGELGDVSQVVVVEVPGVPLGGSVPVQLEQVPASALRDQLAVGGQVAHRGEQPVGVNGDGDEAVDQHDARGPALDRRSGARRTGTTAQPCTGRGTVAGAVVRR